MIRIAMSRSPLWSRCRATLLVIKFSAPHIPHFNGHPAQVFPAETPRLLTIRTSPHPAPRILSVPSDYWELLKRLSLIQCQRIFLTLPFIPHLFSVRNIPDFSRCRFSALRIPHSWVYPNPCFKGPPIGPKLRGAIAGLRAPEVDQQVLRRAEVFSRGRCVI